jgi:hypothetical protein
MHKVVHASCAFAKVRFHGRSLLGLLTDFRPEPLCPGPISGQGFEEILESGFAESKLQIPYFVKDDNL